MADDWKGHSGLIYRHGGPASCHSVSSIWRNTKSVVRGQIWPQLLANSFTVNMKI